MDTRSCAGGLRLKENMNCLARVTAQIARDYGFVHVRVHCVLKSVAYGLRTSDAYLEGRRRCQQRFEVNLADCLAEKVPLNFVTPQQS